MKRSRLKKKRKIRLNTLLTLEIIKRQRLNILLNVNLMTTNHFGKL